MRIIDNPENQMGRLQDGWQLTDGGRRLERNDRFPDFTSALLFVNAVGHHAEAMDHHPDITLGYGRCTIALTTHDAGGLTERDFQLAERIDTLKPDA
ncbi:MAG: 4a-hydroxytetrahydrobiopterin dehydratase [Halothiobacillaceae bacterium]